MYLVETLPVVLVLAGVGISHVGKAFRAEGWNAGEANFRATSEDGITYGEMPRIIDSDNVSRVGNLKVGCARLSRRGFDHEPHVRITTLLVTLPMTRVTGMDGGSGDLDGPRYLEERSDFREDAVTQRGITCTVSRSWANSCWAWERVTCFFIRLCCTCEPREGDTWRLFKRSLAAGRGCPADDFEAVSGTLQQWSLHPGGAISYPSFYIQ